MKEETFRALRFQLSAAVVGVENALEREGPGRKADAEVTHKALARRLSRDTGTVGRWERHNSAPAEVMELLRCWARESRARQRRRKK